jgi:hypothetical protein
LQVLEPFDSFDNLLKFAVLALLLYSPEDRVLNLVHHSSGSGLQLAGEDTFGEILAQLFDVPDLSIRLALGGLGCCPAALISIGGIMPPAVLLRWLYGSRARAAISLISGALCH